MNIAEGNHAILVLARHRDHEGVGAGGQQQAVVVGAGAIFGNDLLVEAVNPGNGLALVQGDAIVAVPLLVVEHDVIDGLLAGQYRGEHDAVVVAVGFGAEHRDVIHVRCNLQQFFQGAYPCHAVANQYQFLFHVFILLSGLFITVYIEQGLCQLCTLVGIMWLSS